MSEEELRKEAVRRRQAGESAEEMAAALGRTSRWVRKWSDRAETETDNQDWAAGRSRAPSHLTRRAPAVSCVNRSSTPGAAWSPTPEASTGRWPWPGSCGAWASTRSRRAGRSSGSSTAEGLARPRRRQAGYVSKGVPYPDSGQPRAGHHPPDRHGRPPPPRRGRRVPRPQPHRRRLPRGRQRDPHSPPARHWWPPAWPRCGPRSACPPWPSSTTTPTSEAGSPRPGRISARSWPPAWTSTSSPRFMPLREPWRNGIVEHFNDVWDKSFFRTARFTSLDHLRAENASFVAFHNQPPPLLGPRRGQPRRGMGRSALPPAPRGYESRPACRPRAHRGHPLHALQPRLDLFGKRLTLAARAHPSIRHRHHQSPRQTGHRRHHQRRDRPRRQLRHLPPPAMKTERCPAASRPGTIGTMSCGHLTWGNTGTMSCGPRGRPRESGPC